MQRFAQTDFRLADIWLDFQGSCFIIEQPFRQDVVSQIFLIKIETLGDLCVAVSSNFFNEVCFCNKPRVELEYTYCGIY